MADTIGKTMVMRSSRIAMYGRASAEEFSEAEWFARAAIAD